jgi:Na+/H+ antiporter NhaD/arsenite permease-like protein
MMTGMSKWAVPAVGFVVGLLVAAAELGRRATPLQAALAFAIVAAYALGLRLLQSRSETASLLSGLPVDERWESINNRALALAAQVIAVIILVVFLVTEYEGGDAMPYALLEAAFAAAYFGGILWYRWRQ